MKRKRQEKKARNRLSSSLNQLWYNTMDGGGIDLPHPPLPFARWGVAHIVRGQNAPTALIPCDFALAGCIALVGLQPALLVHPFNPISFMPSLYFISTPEGSKALLQVLIMEAVSLRHLLWYSGESLSISFRTDLGTSFSTKPPVHWIIKNIQCK